MFDESAFEEYLVEQVRTYDTVKRVTRATQFNTERLEEWTKIVPACIIHVSSERFVEDRSAQGTVQLLEYDFHLVYVLPDLWKDAAANRYTALRASKYNLRGAKYHQTGEAPGIIYYRGWNILEDIEGLVFIDQLFALRILDSNE